MPGKKYTPLAADRESPKAENQQTSRHIVVVRYGGSMIERIGLLRIQLKREREHPRQHGYLLMAKHAKHPELRSKMSRRAYRDRWQIEVQHHKTQFRSVVNVI